MAETGPTADLLGRFLHAFAEVQPLIPTYTHLLLSAIFPIYAGAHASLSRPSSAAKLQKRKGRSKDDEDEDDEDEEDKIQRMEGLSPSDALMFPVLAGCTLAGLYFLIKWLQDPALLNKILNWYFAIFGSVSVAKLIADVLAWTEGMVFPSVWVGDGVVWEVKSSERLVVAKGKTNGTRNTPLPGLLSKLPLPGKALDALWTLREVPKHKWTVQVYARHVASARTHIGVNGFIGTIIACVAVMYFNLVDKPWWLTNLMGFGFSYGALQLMSPTTFSTGTLILSALFFYDIYFVFYTYVPSFEYFHPDNASPKSHLNAFRQIFKRTDYTSNIPTSPMMVTVAKSLDIPIKLLFPRPPAPGEAPEAAKRTHAMLGLGDVVLPGIMIGLALRFDLFMHYLRKQKRSQMPVIGPRVDSPKGEGEVKETEVKETETKEMEVTKAPYKSVSGKWGDAFWAHSWTGRSLIPNSPNFDVQLSRETSFPKPYFHASVAGYLLGLLTTLGIMHVFEHAQPALLYLVPGVLISLFLTGIVRGELKEMWEFTEAEEEEATEKTDDQEKKENKKGDGKNKENEADDKTKSKKSKEEKKDEDVQEVKVGKHKERVLIAVSISKREFASRRKQEVSGKEDVTDDGGLRRSPRLRESNETGEGEPPHKMRRMS